MNKRTRKPVVEAHEIDLFRASVSDVTPLARSGKIQPERPPARPIPEQRLRDDRAALQDSLDENVARDVGLETGDELSFARNGVGSQVLRKLRRGHWVVQDELDLHGLTSFEAREMLARFLSRCVRRGLRCIRIIHGKGLRSKNREPVLKGKLTGWLVPRDEVLAFAQAPAASGGAGALLVLLKAR